MTNEIVLTLTMKEAKMLSTMLFRGVQFFNGEGDPIGQTAYNIYDALASVGVTEDNNFHHVAYAQIKRAAP